MMFETLKHVPKTEKRCSVFKDDSLCIQMNTINNVQVIYNFFLIFQYLTTVGCIWQTWKHGSVKVSMDSETVTE